MASTKDYEMREGLRESLAFWIKKLECNGDVEKQHHFKRKFIAKLRDSPIAVCTEAANEQHYEVPTAFYTTLCDKRLKYSCGFWPEGITDIGDAQVEMLKLICERAKVADGQIILDLGCGWGSLAFYICESYPLCQVVCVSNSNTQREYIESRAEKCGFRNRLRCFTADANHFQTEELFDRIISVEMLEHMKNYQQLFANIAGWLKSDGLLFSQILCHRQFPYAFDTRQDADTEWMARHFFTGGTMSSSDLFLYFQDDLVIVDHWVVSGIHYHKTLEAWLKKLDENIDAAGRILKQTYGEKDGEEHLQRWRMFFIFCSEVFRYHDGNEWIVAHHLFKKRLLSSL